MSNLKEQITLPFGYIFNVDYFIKTCGDIHKPWYELMRIFQSCGNNIGTKFWKIITNEHGIKPTTGVYEGDSDLQLQRIYVYFTSGIHGKCVPISVMVELNSTTLDYVLNSNLGKLFQPDYFIGGSSSASNNCERHTALFRAKIRDWKSVTKGTVKLIVKTLKSVTKGTVKLIVKTRTILIIC